MIFSVSSLVSMPCLSNADSEVLLGLPPDTIKGYFEYTKRPEGHPDECHSRRRHFC